MISFLQSRIPEITRKSEVQAECPSWCVSLPASTCICAHPCPAGIFLRGTNTVSEKLAVYLSYLKHLPSTEDDPTDDHSRA